MTAKTATGGTILKLLFWSLVVGFIMYQLEWSPGDIVGWIADQIAGIWDWFAGFGLNYVLLGATIVVPVYLLMRLRDRMKGQ